MIYLLCVNYTIVRHLFVSKMPTGKFEHVREYLILASSGIYAQKKSRAYTSVFHNFNMSYDLAWISLVLSPYLRNFIQVQSLQKIIFAEILVSLI